MSDRPVEVRILPMDSEKEFSQYGGWEDVQDRFFLQKLPLERNGFYMYRNRSLNAKCGAVVLFQYKGQIIASAVYTHRIPFSRRRDGYNGGLHFETGSIRVFKPLDASAVKRIWPRFKGFGRAKSDLAPEHYTTFKSQQTMVRKSPLRAQKSIVQIRCKKLKCLRPVMEKWVELNSVLAKRWLNENEGDVPWWYNERTLLGLFAGAVWRSRGVSLEEFSYSKRMLTKRGRVTDKSRTGRADLYFEMRNKPSFMVEAKHVWLRTSSGKDQKWKLKRFIQQVRYDTRRVKIEKETYRLAITFVTPSVSFKKTKDISMHIRWAIKQTYGFKCDAFACVFPEPGKYGKDTDYTYPGIIMLVKQVGR